MEMPFVYFRTMWTNYDSSLGFFYLNIYAKMDHGKKCSILIQLKSSLCRKDFYFYLPNVNLYWFKSNSIGSLLIKLPLREYFDNMDVTLAFFILVKWLFRNMQNIYGSQQIFNNIKNFANKKNIVLKHKIVPE